MKIVLLNRPFEAGRSNVTLVAQDGEKRTVVWGHAEEVGFAKVDGFKHESTEKSLNVFLHNREQTGYVVVAEATINIPSELLASFVLNNLGKIMKVISFFR